MLLPAILLSGCAGVSFSKSGESDAKAACAALQSTQGENVSIEQGIAGFAEAEARSQVAAEMNDDYALLASAMRALNESLISGSEDMAQSAWANAARICNDL